MSLRLADATVLLALVLSSATPRHGARAQTPAPGDGGPSSAASFVAPTEVMIDRAGNLYVTERAGYRVRRIDARTGVITTYAGSERGYSGDGGPATAARFDQLSGMAVDSAGNLFIGDLWNSRIRRVDARTGIVTTVVGTGTAGYSGDGGPALEARISAAFDLTFDRQGNLIFTDTENHRIRRVDARTGVISTIVGTGRWDYSGDGGPATAASVARPHCVLITPENDLIICDSFNHRIRRIDGRTGIITTIAGNGRHGSGGDGGPAQAASLTYVGDMALDTAGNLFFSDVSTHRIRRIDARTGIITTIAGDGRARFAGDGGPATEGSFATPAGLELDAAGGLLVADMWNGRIRRIDLRTGTLSTIAGSMLSPETSDWFFRPLYDATAVRAANNRPPALDIAESGRVRQVDMAYPRERQEPPGIMSVFIPAGLSGADRRPVVVLVHGRTNQEVRPRESGGLMGWARLLAASGFIAVLPDTRLGATGASADHTLDDLHSTLDVVRANDARVHADPARVCFLTFSDGVAPVVPMLSGLSTRPRCLVSFYPMADVTDNRVGAWSNEPVTTRERMSLSRVAADRAYRIPTLIARGDRDQPSVNEPLARLEEATSAGGAPVSFLSHPTGQHGFERLLHDEESVRIIRQAIEFLRTHLR